MEVLNKFIELIDQLQPSSVGLYKSFGSELDTILLDAFLRERNIAVYYPKLIEGEMNFVLSNSVCDFSKSISGFLEPVNHGEVSVPELVITPALALDNENYRLGYGKGYYDKYIKQHQNKQYISFILKNFILEKLPRDEWDLQINKIIEINVPNINIMK